MRTIIQDLTNYHSITQLNICPQLSLLRGMSWLSGQDQGGPVWHLNLFENFIKKIDLAASLSCLLLGYLSLIRKEVVVDLIKVFQWRVGEGEGGQ